jgi:hypothetical protein
MKNSYKAVLLAVLGLTVASAAQAATSGVDLALGFNDPSGPSSAQNDFVIDLGSVSQIGLTTSMTWSGSSLDGGDFASDFTSAFGTDGSALNRVGVGLVQGNSVGGANGKGDLIQTGNESGTPSITAIQASIPGAGGIVLGSYGSTSAANGADSANNWTTQSGNITTATGNPIGDLSGGIVSELVYEDDVSGTARNPSTTPWVELGTLTVNLNSDTVTFTGIDAVPEPATYGLLAGAGLLVVSLRNQFRRKQA